MNPNTSEFQRAQALDKIFKILGSSSRGKQMLSTMVATQTGIPDKILDKLLAEETIIFQQVVTSDSLMAYGDATMVQLTPYGEQQYKAGWTFIQQLTQDENDNVQRIKRETEHHGRKDRIVKREKIGLYIIGGMGWLIATGIAFWDARSSDASNKLEQMEIQWEQKRNELQSDIQQLQHQLNRIPDSIKIKYK